MNKHDLTVGILSHGDPHDVRTWSGVPYFILQELERRFERVIYIPAPPPKNYELVRKLDVASRKWLKRGFLPWATLGIARYNGRVIQPQLEAQSVDVLLSITADHQFACLPPGVPVIHHSDTTFAAIENYYPFFADLWGWARHAGHEICQRALRRAYASVYPSQWAVDSAVEHYGIDPAKLHVVPYGANLQEAPDRSAVLGSERRKRCQLLFIGVDWQRKGGVQAYATMQALRDRGIDANLVVIGCTPGPEVDRTHVELHGFLNKQDPQQLKTYNQLWLESSFLCMPTRAETFGAVFAEAAAYGLPVITSKTGGVPSAVLHNETGILLPLDATGDAFADQVQAIWNTSGRYEQFVTASRDRYERELNWSAWVDAVTPILVQAVESRQAPNPASSVC